MKKDFLSVFITSLFVNVRAVNPPTDPQARGQPLVGCPRVLIQHTQAALRYTLSDHASR
jgi:hypothetical protein